MFNKLDELKEIIAHIELEINKAKSIFNELGISVSEADTSNHDIKARSVGSEKINGDSKIIEGVFDGQQMIGPDGKKYSIPANYCSKSKLVEGDILKLTIKIDGTFVYKQIGPIERKRVKGKLVQDSISGDFKVISNEREYKTLKASVTYFQGESGDDVIILVPQDGESIWAAVENIVKNPQIADADYQAQFDDDLNSDNKLDINDSSALEDNDQANQIESDELDDLI
ncbi:hypothetical protein K8R66_04655 [bacterium]|nr:hypothetical protein [bacterium]